MSRTLPHLSFPSELRPRHRVALAALAALALVVTAALFVPRGDDPDDGGLSPTTGSEYAATQAAPGPGRVTPQERDEITRVLDSAPAQVNARLAPQAQAEQLVRCADFEEQRYCLGVGWTDLDPDRAAQRAAATAHARPAAVETTGDLTTAELLAQRAAMPPAKRRAVERRELVAAARSVAKVVLLRHDILGEPLPDGFLDRHPEARASTSSTTASTPARVSARTSARKGLADYPRRSKILNAHHVREQHRTYWCGPTTMQMIVWGWSGHKRRQLHWANRLHTTTSGTGISDMVRVVNHATGYDREKYAGKYIVLDISDWNFRQWLLLQMRHIEDYQAPVVLHPILLKRFYPYLDDDASGHFQVGRGYAKHGKRPTRLGYFEPWNQQRFDRSEPYIQRVQWRRAYRSYRANKAHPQQNIGV